jgi:hypothetical protein
MIPSNRFKKEAKQHFNTQKIFIIICCMLYIIIGHSCPVEDKEDKDKDTVVGKHNTDN